MLNTSKYVQDPSKIISHGTHIFPSHERNFKFTLNCDYLIELYLSLYCCTAVSPELSKPLAHSCCYASYQLIASQLQIYTLLSVP